MSKRYPTFRDYRKYTRRVARKKHEQLTNLGNLLKQRNNIIEAAFQVIKSQAELIEYYATAPPDAKEPR